VRAEAPPREATRTVTDGLTPASAEQFLRDMKLDVRQQKNCELRSLL
jgi:hypothetical protein